MTHNIQGKTEKSNKTRSQSQIGFSVLEVLISICIFLPIMAGAMQLFSVGINQHTTEQNSVEATQEASTGFNMLATEIAQAGSHSDASTTIGAAIIGSAIPQPVPVASSDGFCIGDFIEVYNSAGDMEIVEITGVSFSDTITGAFLNDYADGDTIRLFAMPYLQGILPPTTLAPNTQTSVTTLRFFGDMYGDGNMYYVEYVYDNDNAQITRSMTPFNQTMKEPAVPLIGNILANSTQFVLNTDDRGIITSVDISLTVESQIAGRSENEELDLYSKVTIPSAEAASTLLNDIQTLGGINRLPPMPQRLALWMKL